jgi:hypothetical protein
MQSVQSGFMFVFVATFNFQYLFSQPAEKLIKVMVAPDHENWTYKMGENTISCFSLGWQSTQKCKNCLRGWIGKNDPQKKDSLVIPTGSYAIPGGTLKQPGFIRCIVTAQYEGKTYRGLGTAGFDPQDLKPVIDYPSDLSNSGIPRKQNWQRFHLMQE